MGLPGYLQWPNPTPIRPSQPFLPAGSVSGSIAAAEDAGLPEAANQQGEAGPQMQRETGPHYHARHPGRRMMEARKRSFDALSEASCMVVLHWGGGGRLMPLASQQFHFKSWQTQLPSAHSKAAKMVCRQLAYRWNNDAPRAVLCLVMHTCRRSMVALSKAG